MDSYFEKVKIVRDGSLETRYRYYVLYGMPDSLDANPRKINIDYASYLPEDDKSAKRKLRDLERFMMKVNRNGFYLGVNGGISDFLVSDFDTYKSDIGMLQGNTENGSIVEVELGREKYYTGYYINGGIYSNSPINIYKGGVGISREILNIGNLYLKIRGTVNMAFAYGEMGELYDDMTIGSKEYAAKSKVYASGTGFGFSPEIKMEYDISNNFSVYVLGAYNIYGELSDFTYTVEDKYDSGQTADINIDAYEPSIDLNGMSMRAGIQFDF